MVDIDDDLEALNASQVLNDLITKKYRVAQVHPFFFIVENPLSSL